MSLITSATTYDYESVSYLHEEKQRMFVWGRNIYLVQLLSAATPGMTSPVRKRVPVGQICNRLQAQMDSETGTTSTPLSPSPTGLVARKVFREDCERVTNHFKTMQKMLPVIFTGTMFGLLSYVYTRCGATSIIDATAWGRGVKYHGAVYTRRDVAMI